MVTKNNFFTFPARLTHPPPSMAPVLCLYLCQRNTVEIQFKKGSPTKQKHIGGMKTRPIPT